MGLLPANYFYDLDLPLPDLLPVTCSAEGFGTAQQQSSLEDYLELSVMLQYNLVH